MTRLPFAIVLIVLVSSPAEATLIDLGNGMIYDTVQNLTWAQDLMLSRTLGQDADGRMTQAEAIAWADSLVYGGLDDWRLPNVLQATFDDDGNSEMSRLFYQLGWRIRDRFRYDGRTTGFVGPFVNYGQMNTIPQYWFGNRSLEAWHSIFVFDPPDDGPDALLGAWAVRDGGNPMARVPEPSTLLLIVLGIVPLLIRQRRIRRASKTIGVVCATIFLTGTPQRADASLIDFGGGLIYDTVQDLTWLDPFFAAPPHELIEASPNCAFRPCDWNYTWPGATAWAANLGYEGYNDWRRPIFRGCSATTSCTVCWNSCLDGNLARTPLVELN